MMSFGIYLLKVSVCVAAFYLFYQAFLKHTTFFQGNRMFLICALVFSFILPFLPLPVNDFVVEGKETVFATSFQTKDASPLIVSEQLSKNSFDFSSLIIVIYFAGCVFMAGRFIYSIRVIVRLKKRAVYNNIDGLHTFSIPRISTFSFFNQVFINDDVDPMVLAHERIHVEQKHWIDLLIVELASVVLWFNPVILLYKKAVKIQHEYLADSEAMAASGIEPYLNCLLAHVENQNRFVNTSDFNSQFIKKRITVMTKSKTPFTSSSRYLLAIPVVSILFFAFGNRERASVAKPAIEKHVFAAMDVPSNAPVDVSKVKSVVGFGQKHNVVTNQIQNHTGFDFVMNEGENVVAPSNGMVMEAGYDEVMGNYIFIRHTDRYVTHYYHCKSLNVHAGDLVRKGQLIGRVGSTGLSAGNHLHYEVIEDGKAVNPKFFLSKSELEWFKDEC